MRKNAMQEQLLKAGLVSKGKLAQAAQQQARQRKGREPAAAEPTAVDVGRLQAERAERDRALAAERNARARAGEAQAQARQIIQANRLEGGGDIAYRFEHGAAFRTVYVDASQRRQLASGALVIVSHEGGYALLPRAAGQKVAERDATLVVLDHAGGDGGPASDSDDPYYARFEVPDDLVW